VVADTAGRSKTKHPRPDVTAKDYLRAIRRKKNEEARKTRERRHLAAGGDRCLFCGNREVHHGDPEHYASEVEISVWCEKCKKEWTEVFRLHSVREDV
jgi:hypothetical protein